MEELTGLYVKIFLNASYGITVASGKFIKKENDFIVVESNQGPIYIPLANIQVIKVVKDND